jgi:2'-5' RNA ligase
MSEDIRAFVAVRLSPELLSAVQRLQERLERELKCKAIRWTKAEQLHLTLWFLGNVPAERVAALQAALQNGCAGCKPMKFCGLQVQFPELAKRQQG